MASLEHPHFANEAEEARWWFEHRVEAGKNLVTASRQKRTGGGVAQRALSVKQSADREDLQGRVGGAKSDDPFEAITR